jgi:hypothetical protein
MPAEEKAMPLNADYFRKQSVTCFELARFLSDGKEASQLRSMAEQYRLRADRLDAERDNADLDDKRLGMFRDTD